jgi:hypothetical protein
MPLQAMLLGILTVAEMIERSLSLGDKSLDH